MTTSQKQLSLTDILEGHPIPAGTLEYFRARLRSKFHQLVLDEFLRQEDSSGLTKAELARRIGKGAHQVNRWLGAPGNWTLQTVSDLLLAMGSEPEFAVLHIQDRIDDAEKWGDSDTDISREDLEQMPVEPDSAA
jgi:plasmid maintenance system antidote protein VapI